MVARIFVRHLAVFEPTTEVPPWYLLPHHYRRVTPHLYTPVEIAALLAPSTPALFVSTRGTRLDEASIPATFARLTQTAGIQVPHGQPATPTRSASLVLHRDPTATATVSTPGVPPDRAAHPRPRATQWACPATHRISSGAGRERASRSRPGGSVEAGSIHCGGYCLWGVTGVRRWVTRMSPLEVAAAIRSGTWDREELPAEAACRRPRDRCGPTPSDWRGPTRPRPAAPDLDRHRARRRHRPGRCRRGTSAPRRPRRWPRVGPPQWPRPCRTAAVRSRHVRAGRPGRSRARAGRDRRAGGHDRGSGTASPSAGSPGRPPTPGPVPGRGWHPQRSTGAAGLVAVGLDGDRVRAA